MASLSFNPTTTSPRSVSHVIFGSLSSCLDKPRLLRLRGNILNSPDLRFLLGVIDELPSVWPVIRATCPQVGKARGADQLEQVKQFLHDGVLSFGETGSIPCLTASLLTVLSHVTEYIIFSRNAPDASCGDSHGWFHEVQEVQGFCIGFLAAAAVACSDNKSEFCTYASVALRLAVCIGATIDAAEDPLPPSKYSRSYSVRRKTETEKKQLDAILESVTGVRFFWPLTLYHLINKMCISIH